MTKSVLVALAVAALTPAATQGAVVLAPAAEADASTDGFSVSILTDGAEHVLASVDDHEAAAADPFGNSAIAFMTNEIATRQAGPAKNNAAAYSSAEAAAQEPLPEPATWLMMILGFFGLSFAVRRRSSVTGNRVRFS